MGCVGDLKQLLDSGRRYYQRMQDTFKLYIWTFKIKQRDVLFYLKIYINILGHKLDYNTSQTANTVYWSPMLVFPMTSGALGLLAFILTSSSSVAGDTQVILSPWKVSVCGLTDSAISWEKRVLSVF